LPSAPRWYMRSVGTNMSLRSGRVWRGRVAPVLLCCACLQVLLPPRLARTPQSLQGARFDVTTQRALALWAAEGTRLDRPVLRERRSDWSEQARLRFRETTVHGKRVAYRRDRVRLPRSLCPAQRLFRRSRATDDPPA